VKRDQLEGGSACGKKVRRDQREGGITSVQKGIKWKKGCRRQRFGGVNRRGKKERGSGRREEGGGQRVGTFLDVLFSRILEQKL
jgi:hypothetical protein